MGYSRVKVFVIRSLEIGTMDREERTGVVLNL